MGGVVGGVEPPSIAPIFLAEVFERREPLIDARIIFSTADATGSDGTDRLEHEAAANRTELG